jgi:hypothetical protein
MNSTAPRAKASLLCASWNEPVPGSTSRADRYARPSSRSADLASSESMRTVPPSSTTSPPAAQMASMALTVRPS